MLIYGWEVFETFSLIRRAMLFTHTDRKKKKWICMFKIPRLAICRFNLFQLLGDPEVTANIYCYHATYPTQIRKITVQICVNFWVPQYIFQRLVNETRKMLWFLHFIVMIVFWHMFFWSNLAIDTLCAHVLDYDWFKINNKVMLKILKLFK